MYVFFYIKNIYFINNDNNNNIINIFIYNYLNLFLKRKLIK